MANQYDFDDNTEYFLRHKKKQKSEKFLWYGIIAVSLGLIYFNFEAILNEFPLSPSNQMERNLQNNNSTPSIAEGCSDELPNDGVLVHNSLDNSAYDNSFPTLEASNTYKSPVVLLIGKTDFSSYDRSITLHPSAKAAMYIPQGTYGLTLLVGKTWCNFEKGFIDGKRIKISKPVNVIVGQTSKIKVDGIGKNQEGIHIDIVHIAAANALTPNNKEEITANTTAIPLPKISMPSAPQAIPQESSTPIISTVNDLSITARVEECNIIRKNATEIIEERMRHRYSSQEGEYFRRRLRQIDDNYSTCKSSAES